MFTEFFLREIKAALKQPMVYIFFFIMTILVFGATASSNIQIGGAVGNVLKNSPHVIAFYTSILSIFGLLIATAFFNNAALRDYNNGFNEILFSTPLKKSGYFFGRFFGALVLATIPLSGVFAGVYLGAILGSALGWIEPERIGDTSLIACVNAYLLFILPNMFFAGAIVFALATKWKSTTISFVGALGIIVTYLISGTLLSDIENDSISALSGAFGVRAHTLDTRYFTPAEKNTIGASFSGFLLINRIVWITVGSGILFLSYSIFSFRQKHKKLRSKKAIAAETQKAIKPSVFPNVQTHFGFKTQWQYFISFFKLNFLSIIKSNTFKILFLFCVILLITDMAGGFEYFGLQSYPVTYKMIDLITDTSSIFMIIILVFFSGELVWRDRACNINEVIDASPHSSFASVFAKILSLLAVITTLHFLFVFIAMVSQLLSGYKRLEFGIYTLEFLYNKLPAYFTWSVIFVFFQTILSNKYVGYFTSILIVFLQGLVFVALDVRSNMVAIAGTPDLQYSDMNAFGPGLKGALWFNLYWVLFAILVLLTTGLLWSRGKSFEFKHKLQIAKKHITKGYGIAIACCAALWLLTAGFVYYNTQILNTYQTNDELEQLMVDYETTYKKYENAPIPKITAVNYFVDIFPYKRDVKVKAEIELINKSGKQIDSIHYNVDEHWNPKISIPNAKLVLNDEKLGYQIYELSTPLDTNEKMNITIEAYYESNGFENDRGNTSIVDNGTFLNNMAILPMMGYSSARELSARNTRREYGLPPKERTPELEANCTENCMINYLTDGRSDYVDVETVISTASDQIAIAPGTLIKEWKEGSRNYYNYKVEQPSQNFYSFISAKFEVKKKKWNGIDIEIYYDKKHAYNVDRMIQAVENSLKYYTENFGPYYHKQARIIEFPRYSTFAQAFPGTMPYSESFGFIINLEDEAENNVVDAVIAHEMAHQWWAHQECGADMQGGTMLTESFSEYSSLMVMKTYSDDMKMKQFLKYDLNRYLRGRSGEHEKELPLYKVENQSYIHYGKGSVILYALQDYIGEDKVNTALKNFLEEFRYKAPPYPTSLDFLEHLEPQVPDSLKYLIDDWFKEITLYDFRLKDATYTKNNNDKYEVTMTIEAYKLKADTLGNETKVSLNDWVDIGVYTGKEGETLTYNKRVKFNQSGMEFTFETDSRPMKAAIDPRRILIERDYDDNTKTVTEKKSS